MKKLPEDLPEPEETTESTLDTDDDFLDAFLADDFDDGSLNDFGFSKFSDGDGDEDFDSYFRNADSHHRARDRRRRRRDRSREEAFDFGMFEDWREGRSRSRRPRR